VLWIIKVLNISYALWNCFLAMDVCRLGSLWKKKKIQKSFCFLASCGRDVQNKCDMVEFELFVEILENKIIKKKYNEPFMRKFLHPNLVAGGIIGSFEEYKKENIEKSDHE
jgi:hypothetical protein